MAIVIHAAIFPLVIVMSLNRYEKFFYNTLCEEMFLCDFVSMKYRIIENEKLYRFLVRQIKHVFVTFVSHDDDLHLMST